MTKFETTLKNTDRLTEDTAQELREQLLAALEYDDSWTLDSDSAEPCVDETGDWHLFTLSHEDSHDRCVTVLIHAITLTIQTYLEPAGVYTEPSQSIEHIQTALSD